MNKAFYIYGSNFLAVAAGATVTNSLAIQADANFEVLKLCFASDLNAGVQTDSTRTIPQCTLLITDTGSGRQIMNQGIDLTAFFGNGLEPFILPTPHVFAANSAIALQLTNYSAAQVYNIRLAFIGNKVYR